ncbi:MAG: hypothetical protein ABII82_13345, partial [Verrucomicrobiota bacterium]
MLDPLGLDSYFETRVEGKEGIENVGRISQHLSPVDGVDFGYLGGLEVPAQQVNNVAEQEMGDGRASGPLLG